MRLHGIHHITAITADAQRNVDFYAGLLGLRLVKKTVNFDAPDYYHLYYGDELGTPGSVVTFFEFPESQPGRAGAGMIHRIIWRVRGERSLDFWAERLESAAVPVEREPAALRFADPEGLDLELVAIGSDDPPLTARASDVPLEHALLGLQGVRAYSAHPAASHHLLTRTLRFTPLIDGAGHRLRGGTRGALYHYDRPPAEPPRQGAGTVHHIAWTSSDEDHARWREQVVGDYVYPTEIIDRMYFHSIYFREPSGVLFELATRSPGFAVDEEPERLGEELKLPPQHEPLRPGLELALTPIRNPRGWTIER